MVLYQIGPELSLVDHCTEGQVLVLLTSQELSQHPELKCLEGVLQHTPLARDARVCKAEARRDCLCGTIVTPRYTKEGERIAFGYMLTASVVVICDDSGAAHALIKRLGREKRWQENGPGRLFYEFLELLIYRDLHHLEEMEDQLAQMEDRGLSGELDGFNAQAKIN